jgi:kynurenine formamidase
MPEIIDLSQEIFAGMPIFKGLPEVKMSIHSTHEEWAGLVDAPTQTPNIYKLEMCEHTGSHVDALNHMGAEYKEQSIDTMPLSMFYTSGICLDFSSKNLRELISSEEIINQCKLQKLKIKAGDTVLICTNHYQKTYKTPDWANGPGITAEAATWLGNKKIAAFGVETMSPGVSGISNKDVHRICGELGFTHYENLINLHLLLGRGRFRFIAFPLKIKGGTGSPVRAVAIFE